MQTLEFIRNKINNNTFEPKNRSRSDSFSTVSTHDSIASTATSTNSSNNQSNSANTSHNDPVSQVTQASQVLNHSVTCIYQKNPKSKSWTCSMKFSDNSLLDESGNIVDYSYDPIFGQGIHADKRQAKMKAAEVVLMQIEKNFKDWKEQQIKNRVDKKRKYQSGYRKRKDEENRERFERIEREEREERQKKRKKNDDKITRKESSDSGRRTSYDDSKDRDNRRYRSSEKNNDDFDRNHRHRYDNRRIKDGYRERR